MMVIIMILLIILIINITKKSEVIMHLIIIQFFKISLYSNYKKCISRPYIEEFRKKTLKEFYLKYVFGIELDVSFDALKKIENYSNKMLKNIYFNGNFAFQCI